MKRLMMMAAVGVSIAATPAMADTWRRIGETGSAPDRVEFFINTDSIRRSGDTLTVETTTIYERQRPDRDYTRSILSRRIDCARSMSQIMFGRYYDAARLVSTDQQPADLVTPTQGSVGYDIVMATCGKGQYYGPPISDPVAASRALFTGAGDGGSSTTTSSTAVPPPSMTGVWRLASNAGAKPNRSLFYIDTASIRRDGDMIDFKSVTLYEGGTSSDRDYDRSLIQRHGNCATMSSQMIVAAFYAGDRLLESANASRQWLTHTQGSIIYGAMLAACGKRDYQTRQIDDPLGASRAFFAESK